MKPVEIINLKPSDGHGKIVLEPLLSEIDVPVANTDVPYLVKIEISPNTTCWPPKSYLLMMLGSQEKERWYKGKGSKKKLVFVLKVLLSSFTNNSSDKRCQTWRSNSSTNARLVH